VAAGGKVSEDRPAVKSAKSAPAGSAEPEIPIIEEDGDINVKDIPF